MIIVFLFKITSFLLPLADELLTIQFVFVFRYFLDCYANNKSIFLHLPISFFHCLCHRISNQQFL